MPQTALSPQRHQVDPERLNSRALSPPIEPNRSPAVRASQPRFFPGTLGPEDGLPLERHIVTSGPAACAPRLFYTPLCRVRLPAILHLHGGGYITGDAQRRDAWHRYLGLPTGTMIVSVNQGLVAETEFAGAEGLSKDAVATRAHDVPRTWAMQ